MSGTIDSAGEAKQGEPLNQLRVLALESLHYDSSSLSEELKAAQVEYKENVIAQLHPRELISIIFQQPIVRLESTGGHNTGLKATHTVNPVMNLYFI